MKIRSVLRVLASTAALTTIATLTGEAAAAPGTVTHQGRLYDSMGVPVTDTLDVVFSIYAGPADPVAVWTETHTISFEDGYYSVRLGTETTLDPRCR